MFIPASLARFLFSVTATAILIASSAAAPITWGPPTLISGDQDVSTVGTLIAAFKLSNTGFSDTIVNGVSFEELYIQPVTTTSGNFTLATSPFTPFITYLTSGDTPPFTDLSASYQYLLRYTGFVRGQPASFTLTMSGLSVGSTYLFEWWNQGYPDPTTATAGNSVTLESYTGTNLGQFATGTFAADAATQTINFTSSLWGPQMNAFQLRVIPEPSTWMLFGTSALFLIRVRRRKARAK